MSRFPGSLTGCSGGGGRQGGNRRWRIVEGRAEEASRRSRRGEKGKELGKKENYYYKNVNFRIKISITI